MDNLTQDNPILNLKVPLKETVSGQTQILSTTIGKQLSIYLISFFLPPFGLIPAYKYVKQTEFKYRKIGYIAVVITLLSVFMAFWATKTVLGTFQNQLQYEQNLYDNLGL